MNQADTITGCAQTISRLDVAVSLGLIARSKVRLLGTSVNMCNSLQLVTEATIMHPLLEQSISLSI